MFIWSVPSVTTSCYHWFWVFWVFRRGAWREDSSLIQKIDGTHLVWIPVSANKSYHASTNTSIYDWRNWSDSTSSRPPMFEISASFLTISLSIFESMLGWGCLDMSSSIFVDLPVSIFQCTYCHEIHAPATGLQRLFFLGWIIAKYVLAAICQHLLWLHCSVSSMLRRGSWPIYVLVIMWREHYVICIGFRIGARVTYKLCTLMHASVHGADAGLHPKHVWPRWLSCLVARTFVLLRLDYTIVLTNEIWDQGVLSCRTDSMECSATQSCVQPAALACFRKKLQNFSIFKNDQVYGPDTILKL